MALKWGTVADKAGGRASALVNLKVGQTVMPGGLIRKSVKFFWSNITMGKLGK